MERHPRRHPLPVALLALVGLAVGACDAPPGAEGTIAPETLLRDPPAGAVVLDVRTPSEYGAGHVPGARNIPHDALAGRLDELPEARDTPVVVYCESGHRAGIAADALRRAGYTRVLHLEGDMRAWRAAGRPSAKP